MHHFSFYYRALAVCLCAAFAAGCGAQPAATPTTLPAARSAGHSWMAPNTGSGDLLYVTGACGGICVFTYPGGTLTGQLSDSDEPQGECVDKAGDVFVADYGYRATPAIVEYAHGGTSPIATLSDPGYYPLACSVDPTTGNLAVTSDGPIAIYAGAKGDPTYWVDSKANITGFPVYDDKGNLFVDGEYVGSGGYALVEMPKGSHRFESIKLNIAPTYPGDLQWTGKYLAIADGSTVIYHVAISGTKGVIIGSTLLNGTPGGYQFWIQGGTIIEPLLTSERPDEVGFWRYPSGGKLREKIGGTEFNDAELFGTVVSPATSR